MEYINTEDPSNGTMKILSDGTQVSPRGYYYLLDWNDSDNWKFMHENFDNSRLHSLNIEQYKILFKHATESDFKNL